MSALHPLLRMASVVLATTAWAEPPLTSELAVEKALAGNSELAALAAEVAAADARLTGASLLLQVNPELSGSVGGRSARTGGSLQVEAELSQQLELLGQRGARIEVARAARAGAEARLRARRSEVAAEVRQAFARALAAEQILIIARENLDLAKQTAKAAERRLELGDGSRIEVNTAQIEVGRTASEVSLALKGSAAALGQLRLILALEPTVALRIEGDLRASVGALPEVDVLLRRAMEARADLMAAKRAVEAARAEGAFAARDWLPRPHIGVRYEQEEGDHVVLGTLSFDLPVFNQNQAGRGVAAAQLTQSERALEAIERRVRQDVMFAALRVKTSQDAVQAFEGRVLDAMTENLALINTAYAAGKIDLFELLVIRRNTLEARRSYVEALEELRVAEAELGRALGLEKGAL